MMAQRGLEELQRKGIEIEDGELGCGRRRRFGDPVTGPCSSAIRTATGVLSLQAGPRPPAATTVVPKLATTGATSATLPLAPPTGGHDGPVPPAAAPSVAGASAGFDFQPPDSGFDFVVGGLLAEFFQVRVFGKPCEIAVSEAQGLFQRERGAVELAGE
jgi:hypothetical protein